MKALKNPSNRCRGSAKTELRGGVESSTPPKKTDGSSSSQARNMLLRVALAEVCILLALVPIRAAISKDRIERVDAVMSP